MLERHGLLIPDPVLSSLSLTPWGILWKRRLIQTPEDAGYRGASEYQGGDGASSEGSSSGPLASPCFAPRRQDWHLPWPSELAPQGFPSRMPCSCGALSPPALLLWGPVPPWSQWSVGTTISLSQFCGSVHFFKTRVPSQHCPASISEPTGARGELGKEAGCGGKPAVRRCSILTLRGGIFHRQHPEVCLSYGYSVGPCPLCAIWKVESQGWKVPRAQGKLCNSLYF